MLQYFALVYLIIFGYANDISCTTGEDCPHTAPRCPSGTCDTCKWPVNCERYTGYPICDKVAGSATLGQCITCVGRDNAWCGETRNDALQNVCDPSTGKCVYCLENTDCTEPTPICNVTSNANTCVPCTDNSDCSDVTKSVCDTSTGICGSCADDTGCQHFDDLTICDVDAGTCVECTAGDPHCPSTDPKCTNNVCVNCNWPVNCERFDGLPICDKDDTSATVGQCISCVGRADAWCGETRTDPLQNVCDPSTGKCVYSVDTTQPADTTQVSETTDNLITTEGQHTPPGSGVARYGVFVAMAVVLLIILID